MSIQCNVGGVIKTVKSGKCNISGVWRDIKKGLCNVNGVWREFYNSIFPLYTNGVRNVTWLPTENVYYSSNKTIWGTSQVTLYGEGYGDDEYGSGTMLCNVNVTGYKTLKVEYYADFFNSSNHRVLITCGSAILSTTHSATETVVKTVDISAISGNVDIRIEATGTRDNSYIQIQVFRVWLE